MNHPNQTLGTASRWLRVGEIPDLPEQERERARTRGVVILLIACIWLYRSWVEGEAMPASRLVVLVYGISYSALLLGYSRYARRHSLTEAIILATLVLDPLFLLAILIHDPQTFAFVNSLVLFVVVRSGVRYGLRSLYLAWGATAAASPLLLVNDFWRANVELTLSFGLMLAFVPILFTSLVRRVHTARKIEEERARFAAIHEAMAARSAFLAKVSHELRSPLQSILSALDVFEMRHGSADAHDAELIGRMRRSSLLLNTHLRDLLTLAKGEAGRLEMRPETFEAGALVEALATSARELALAKGLEIVVELPPEPVFVIADASRIDQVLTNLLVNSIQYTDTGQVRISFDGYDEASRRLRFAVADTGPGIPEAALPTLLVPDKLLAGGERRGEGSGLGLAIVRTLTDQLGGTVGVTSEVGRGTRFTLEIPAEIAEDDASDTVPSGAAGRVLIVDDRQEILAGLANVIDELGFECDQAPSAAVGANLLATRRYDVVLIDIDMPVKSGAELAAETRRGSGPNREARFVGMSAGGTIENAGGHFDACLTKPIDHAALRRTLFAASRFLSRPSQPGLWADDETKPRV